MQSSKFFNAALYAAAHAFGAKGGTRFYLDGVYVEPHALGCTLTATDGKILISILDRGGHVDKAEIIRLEPHALKACKPGRDERRYVTFEQGSHVGSVIGVPKRASLETDAEWEAAQTKYAESKSSFVDGAFPDWRHVVVTSQNATPKTNVAGALDGSNLAGVCAASYVLATELGERGDKPVIQFFGADPSRPVIFRFSGIPDAFGLVMPCRSDAPLEIPAWVSPVKRVVGYCYTPALRPASAATLPDGLKWEYVEVPADIAHNRPDLPVSRHKHGLIRTDRELTQEERNRFDLVQDGVIREAEQAAA